MYERAMNLFLIRHMESEKNFLKSFSEQNNQEKLTDKGYHDASELSDALSKLINDNNLIIKNIY